MPAVFVCAATPLYARNGELDLLPPIASFIDTATIKPTLLNVSPMLVKTSNTPGHLGGGRIRYGTSAAFSLRNEVLPFSSTAGRVTGGEVPCLPVP